MGNHTWLWCNHELSDAKLRLVCVSPHARAAGKEPATRGPAVADDEGAGPIDNNQKDKMTDAMHATFACAKALRGDQKQDVLLELPIHTALLASASGYWKTRLLRWRHSSAATVAVAITVNAEQETMGQKTDDVRQAAVSVTLTVQEQVSDVLLEQVDSADDLQIVQYTLRQAYTNHPPDDASIQVLMKMAIYADRWEMPQALESCLRQATTKEGLTADDINTAVHGGLPYSITEHAHYKLLIRNCTSALMLLFGRAHEVVVQEEALASFCSLSLNAVQLWAEQDALQVDSENTVAVLFTHWWDQNSDSLTELQAEEACKVLTESLRAWHMSGTFLLCTLEKLPWFRPTHWQFSALKVLHGTDLASVKNKMRAQSSLRQMPEAWRKAAHASDPKSNTFEWFVTRAQLEEMHKDAENGLAPQLCSDVHYWCGYSWKAKLSLRSSKSALFCGLKYMSALPESSDDAGLPPVLPATFNMTVNKTTGFVSDYFNFDQISPMEPGRINGTHDFLEVIATEEPRSSSYPPDDFWKDGKLHLQVQITRIW